MTLQTTGQFILNELRPREGTSKNTHDPVVDVTAWAQEHLSKTIALNLQIQVKTLQFKGVFMNIKRVDTLYYWFSVFYTIC